ncbi:hypothetical protein ACFC3F_14285 [Microbacterium sp. NPDC055910]|uniref:hypothetical protein n=1 Tax=Microbacterium sp. NPDC055910 TaxID=3345659 RepID=UPI0035D7EA5D
MRRAAQTAAVAIVTTLALAGCGSTTAGGGGSSDSAGVPFGASKAEYQAAFADLDQITLITQTAGAPGTITSKYFEEYQEAVTDWSGGKIEFETNFSYSVAPATEVSDAVADGRLDMSYTIPAYQPEELAASNALIDMSITAEQTPLVGLLQLMGWSFESSLASEPIRAEFEKIGLYPLLPVYALGPDVIACSSPRSTLAELKGASARMGTRLNAPQFNALGIEGVSLSVQEIYEALQRGVIDCTTSGPLSLALNGSVEVAPHVRYVPTTGFAGGFASLVINQSVFESLPLPARQLLHDRLDVFVEAQINSGMGAEMDLLVQSEKYGGTVEAFEDDVTAALEDANAGIIEGARSELAGVEDPATFVDDAQSTMESWLDTVVGLGYDPAIGYQEYGQWYQSRTDGDLDAFLDKLFSGDVAKANRPS